MQSLNIGNNETISRGVIKQADGTYLAMTFTKSKEFKTKKSAIKWFNKMTGN